MPPKADMYSNIAIFGDNVTARIHPDWISNRTLVQHGEPTTTTTYAGKSSAQHNQIHRAEQLDYMEDVARKSQGIWLNSIHFAEHGHCTCPRCKELHAKSGLSWYEWRRKEITGYMAQVSDALSTKQRNHSTSVSYQTQLQTMNASASTSTICYRSQPKCSSSCSARTTLHPGTGKCLHATSRNYSKTSS